MALASSAPLGKKRVLFAACHKDSDKCEEGATIDLSCPFLVLESFESFDYEKFRERVRDAFREIAPRLDHILEKDSVRCFLRFFESNEGMHWDLTITAQTLTYMVIHNALQCARVVLEGKAPQFHGMHANPNCMNQYGYFPLHEAAERFSVDMIKLLFRHGASANVRTVGNRVIENLLPLHVAVENACLHKYLEDNLSPRQDYQDYTYNLIHLLCLPEMKIFLDTIKLLAGKTYNIVDEIWKYIEDKELVETAVLLLAAQGQIRGSHRSKRNVNGNQNGFELIMDRLVEHYVNTQKQLEERRAFKCTYLLVRIISSAGEVLHSYIQRHSEVPHLVVFEHVSSVLKDFGFCPTGEGIDIKNLYCSFLHCFRSAPMTAKYLTENVSMSSAFPALHSHVVKTGATVRSTLERGVSHFLAPRLSTQASMELLALQEVIGDVLTEQPDVRSSCFEATDHHLHSGQVYRASVFSGNESAIFKFIWRSHATPRAKFFGWLMVQDKLQCKRNLVMKHILDSAVCDICQQETEDAEHLFSKCPFARQFWIKLGWTAATVPSPTNLWDTTPPKMYQRPSSPPSFCCAVGAYGSIGTMWCSEDSNNPSPGYSAVARKIVYSGEADYRAISVG